MTLFVIIIISVSFQLKQLSAKFLPHTISYSCCSIPISSLVYLFGSTKMWPHLDIFLIVVVLLTATSGGEAAGGRRSVVGGIEIRCPEGKLHEGVGCLVVGGIEIRCPERKLHEGVGCLVG